MLRTIVVAALCSGLLAGCVQNYAEREVTQGAVPGSLVVLNAPEGASVFVDGRPYGVVGQAGAALSPGRHEVVVETNGRRVHSQSVFIAAGARAEVRVP